MQLQNFYLKDDCDTNTSDFSKTNVNELQSWKVFDELLCCFVVGQHDEIGFIKDNIFTPQSYPDIAYCI